MKAPEFDKVQGFNKEANSLWEVQVQIQSGMVFVKFDAGNENTSLDLGEASEQLEEWSMAKMTPIADWKVEGKFNWKLSGMYLMRSTLPAADH